MLDCQEGGDTIYYWVWGSGTPLRQFAYSSELTVTVYVADDGVHSPDPITLCLLENFALRFFKWR
eukprot:scaffold2240_cov87-Skeletonema_marinoi.AAC.2